MYDQKVSTSNKYFYKNLQMVPNRCIKKKMVLVINSTRHNQIMKGKPIEQTLSFYITNSVTYSK